MDDMAIKELKEMKGKTYSYFLKYMEKKKDWIREPFHQILIDEFNPMIKTFTLKKKEIGKILELQCPNDTIMTKCGKFNTDEITKPYQFSIKCLNNNGKESFGTIGHLVAYDIVLAQIHDHEASMDFEKGWIFLITKIKKLIKSDNPNESIIWSGTYFACSPELYKTSFILYPNEKLALYAVLPDIDIDKIELLLEVDIFQRRCLK